MSKRDAGFGGHFVGAEEFPRKGIGIDYGMFWHRVQSILTGAPWPECGAFPSFFEYLFSSHNYLEPLCLHRTTNLYEAK
jgi:hypothetical protein